MQDVECGEQRDGAVALVVVRHHGRRPVLQRQLRLRAIRRLYLAPLVAAQYQRMLGRRQRLANDVFEFLGELQIARDLEAAHTMRLEPVLAPVPQHRSAAHTDLHSHRTRAPVSGRRELRLRRQPHDFRCIRRA